jgi:hypothetical protein
MLHDCAQHYRQRPRCSRPSPRNCREKQGCSNRGHQAVHGRDSRPCHGRGAAAGGGMGSPSTRWDHETAQATADEDPRFAMGHR